MDKKTNPKIFAIVLNYNGKDCLIPCLNSLYLSDYKNLEIVVIDNDSKDGSFELAREKFSKFHFIKNSSNIGFAAGNNVAIRFALEKMADYVFLMNNDALIEKDSLGRLIEEGEKTEKIGLLSPVIFNGTKDSIWFSGGKILWKKMRTVHEKTVFSKNPYLTDYVSGCAVLIKKSVFREIGLFDENFFLYYEDADFSWRAFKKGFNLLIVPSAKAYHLEKSETANSQKLYWLVLSGILFFKKNSSGINRLWMHIYLLARKTRLLLRKISSEKNTDLIQIEKAFYDYKTLNP